MTLVVVDSHEKLVPLEIFRTRKEQQYRVSTGVSDGRVVNVDHSLSHCNSASFDR